MNEAVPRRGDVFLVHRLAVQASRDPKTHRPQLCVAERPHDPDVWTAMSRLTSGNTDDDLPSPANVELSLGSDGWWSRRFIHSVLKSRIGTAECKYRGHLPEPEKSQALEHYKGRLGTKQKATTRKKP